MMGLKKTATTMMLLMLGIGNLIAGEGWMTNIEEAKKVAKKENKALFVEFTGSDWCPPCMMMDKEVFSKESFLKGAQENFILVKVDLPQGDEALARKNEKYVEQYKVRGFPTVILFDPSGEEFTRFVASQYNSVDSMLDQLDKQLRLKDMF